MNEHDLERHRTARIMPGLILVGLGVLFLLAQFFPIGDWFLLVMGLAFLASYFVTRRDGLLWPAGVLTGLGTAILISGRLHLDGPLQAAAILLGLSAGFFGIYLIDHIYTPPTPIAPLWAGFGTGLAGIIFVLIGFGVLSESVWGAIARFWPVVLIIVGIAVIAGALRRRT